MTIYNGDFPYMLIPPNHSWIPGIVASAYIFGAMLVFAGVCIVFKKEARLVSLLLGGVLLMIFSFYFIPYELLVSSNNMHFGDWENAAKELALASGAFVIAASFLGKSKYTLISFLERLAPYGATFFAITIISFAFDHFLYATEAADYVPSWVPFHVFWIYFTGVALLCSGIAIILKIIPGVAASLLGAMILSWVIMLHIPRLIASPVVYLGSELTSAFIALAYGGIAFVIAGTMKSVAREEKY